MEGKTMLTRRFPTLLNQNDERPVRFSDMMDRLFDNAMSVNRTGFAPKIDLAETDKAFEITVMLPGLEKDQIDVQFENNTLIISGERKWKNEEENGRRYHRVETGYGTFTRTLPLPDTVNGDKINAEYRNGELFITIPKLKDKTGKKIKIS
jgi:HSP20 family protein